MRRRRRPRCCRRARRCRSSAAAGRRRHAAGRSRSSPVASISCDDVPRRAGTAGASAPRGSRPYARYARRASARTRGCSGGSPRTWPKLRFDQRAWRATGGSDACATASDHAPAGRAGGTCASTRGRRPVADDGRPLDDPRGLVPARRCGASSRRSPSVTSRRRPCLRPGVASLAQSLLRRFGADERLVVLAPDERLHPVERDVVVDLLGRALHEVAGRRDERPLQAAVEAELQAADGVGDDAGAVGAVPDLELELRVERHVAEGRALHPDVAPLAVLEPRHVVAAGRRGRRPASSS